MSRNVKNERENLRLNFLEIETVKQFNPKYTVLLQDTFSEYLAFKSKTINRLFSNIDKVNEEINKLDKMYQYRIKVEGPNVSRALKTDYDNLQIKYHFK